MTTTFTLRVSLGGASQLIDESGATVAIFSKEGQGPRLMSLLIDRLATTPGVTVTSEPSGQTIVGDVGQLADGAA